MGTIVTRNGAQGPSYRAVVRTAGVTKTKTFGSKKDANEWITTTEAGITNAPRVNRGNTLGFVFAKAILANAAKPYAVRATRNVFEKFTRERGETDLKDCTAAFWVDWVSSWKIKPGSRLTHITRIAGAMRDAEALYDARVNWDEYKLGYDRLKRLKLIKKGKARDRRVTDEEIARIKEAAKSYNTIFPIADVIDFAIATCMRRGEIFRITWADLNKINGKPMMMIRNRKHPTEKVGNDQNIPLLGDAAEIIKRQTVNEWQPEQIFSYEGSGFGDAFQLMAQRAGVENLHFHDLRHEGISRLFEQGYSIPEVCNVSGHKSWECLKIYTNLKGVDMHDGPIAQRASAKPRPALRIVA